MSSGSRVEASDVTVICPKILSQFPDVHSGLSTRVGGVSLEPFGMNLSYNVGDAPENVRENRERFFRVLNIPSNRVAFTRQIHGDTVRIVTGPGSYQACDALITTMADLFLAISVADCLPIFLFDPETLVAGAVHAGWRGSSARIVSKTIQIMAERLRAKPESLFAYIGAAASKCCYEVGEEVAGLFPGEYLHRRADCSQTHLDLKSFNRSLLRDAGLRDENIEESDHCTICEAQLFHSYRREGSRSGRMLGVIGFSERAHPRVSP